MGARLEQDDPIYILREKMLLSKHIQACLIDRELALALTIKAWNMRRAGRKATVRSLAWEPGKGEPFPKITGSLQEQQRGETVEVKPTLKKRARNANGKAA